MVFLMHGASPPLPLLLFLSSSSSLTPCPARPDERLSDPTCLSTEPLVGQTIKWDIIRVMEPEYLNQANKIRVMEPE